MKKIILLGSTGSIGRQALEAIRSLNRRAPGEYQITGLSANTNAALLKEQIAEFRPTAAALTGQPLPDSRSLSDGALPEILYGPKAAAALAEGLEADLVINAIVGHAGLGSTMAAIRSGKDLALANKESLVCAGALVTGELARRGTALYPVDSEHSAVFQCLRGNEGNKVRKIYLTASGGPFRTKTKDELRHVTLYEALRHPTWSMGAKITIDSATMMNKGLEIIEARWLFDVSISQIKVLVHPQSIIHSMAEFEDGAIMAQLGSPDMRMPISYALTYPRRVENEFNKLDFLTQGVLTFEEPDEGKFPCLALAREALKAGGTMPTVMNAANEAAVESFLKGKISYTRIAELIERVMDAYNIEQTVTEEAVYEADAWAREKYTGLMQCQ